MMESGAALPPQSPLALTVGVGIAALWAVGSLAVQLVRTRAFGPRRFFAAPAANPRRGVAYAFGPGMLPGAKESVRTHMSAWVIGIGFHLGAFAGLLSLVLSVLRASPEGRAREILQAACLVGAIAGVALLARRVLDRTLRGLSHPDDYIANLLTTAFAATAFVESTTPTAGPWFLGSAILLLIYLPLGKIRHCIFFFPARYHSAFYFGRRGAYPPRV